MKRLISFVILFVLLLGLASCGASPTNSVDMAGSPSAITAQEMEENGAQIALVTLEKTGTDAMEQLVWNTLSLFAGEEGYAASPYKTSEEEMAPTLELAVKSGAKLIVFVGNQMSEVFQKAQLQYSQTQFLLVGGDENTLVQKNGAILRFATEQAGWLAGYAGVSEGFEKLAYMQSTETAAQRYALGFLLGADAAAAEQGRNVEARPVDADDEAGWLQRLESLYESGTQLLLSNVEHLQNETLVQARRSGALIVMTEGNFELPQSAVLTAVQYNPQNSLYEILQEWAQGSFPGGEVKVCGVLEDGVSLAWEGAGFDNYSQQDYQSAVARMKDGEILPALEEQLALQEDGTLPAPESVVFENLSVILPAPSTPQADADLPQSGDDSSVGAEPVSDASQAQS